MGNIFSNDNNNTDVNNQDNEKSIKNEITTIDNNNNNNNNNITTVDLIPNQTNNTQNNNNNNNNQNNNNNLLEIETRNQMKNYWIEHSESNKITNSLMLLMNEDEKFAMNEKLEILSYLPDYNGLSIVELGAGIGRFTGDLASKATELLAVDFVEKFLNENKQRYKSIYPHIDYLNMDVTKLELNENSYDLVFSNWLMMYLNDEEIKKLCIKLYHWCSNGGYIFFRESCEGGASGDMKRSNNPTFYRNFKVYSKLFDDIPNLHQISCNQIQIYVKDKNKTNQYCWLYQKRLPQ